MENNEKTPPSEALRSIVSQHFADSNTPASLRVVANTQVMIGRILDALSDLLLLDVGSDEDRLKTLQGLPPILKGILNDLTENMQLLMEDKINGKRPE